MGVLFLLLTIIAGFICVIGLGAAAISGRTRVVKMLLAAASVWLIAYIALLFGTSFSSPEKVIPIGEAKAFCGFYLDCHLHVAVKEAVKTEQIGDVKAEGEFLVVTLRFFNDARRAKISLHNVRVAILDPDGAVYERNEAAESELGEPGKRPFYIPIQPEGSFERSVVFDVPRSFGPGKLAVTEGGLVDNFVEALLIGDEDSLFHAHTYLEVPSADRSGSISKRTGNTDDR